MGLSKTFDTMNDEPFYNFMCMLLAKEVSTSVLVI